MNIPSSPSTQTFSQEEREPKSFLDVDYIVLIGDSGVGKNNLMSRFSENKLYAHLPTLGLSFGSRNINVDGKIIEIEMQDISGHERFRYIVRRFYEEAVGALIVYDITQKVTFKNAEQWLKEFRDHSRQPAVAMLIGNKADLAHLRDVPIDEAKAFSERENLLYMETSALNALNVEKAFTKLVAHIYHVMSQKALDMVNDPVPLPKGEMTNIGGEDDHDRSKKTGTSSTERSHTFLPDPEVNNYILNCI